MASSTGTVTKEYTKRPGTSSIRGHLYETKLLSLIYFRAIHDVTIEEFHLATNVDKLGAFDDICFRAKVRDFDKPIAVFIQAKHREKSSVLTLNSKIDLIKYFKSYLEIRRKFKPNNDDVLFDGAFSEIKCFFVIYTTAKGDKDAKPYEGSCAKHLNVLIKTGDVGSQPLHDKKDEELLYKTVIEEQMTTLAGQIAKCINGEFKDINMLMQDDLVKRYHVILAQKVFYISKEQCEGYRIAHFRPYFFDIKDEFLQLFKHELCTEIAKKRKFDYIIVNVFNIDGVYEKFGNGIIYNKNGTFEFIDKTIPNREKLYLDEINKSQESIRKTLEMTLKEFLPSQEFKVPVSFGNQDLTIKGSEKKIERKLNDLTSKIVGLIEKSQPSNIVIIDKSMGEGFLQLSGGIASAVGNLLVSDETSNLLKFNDNYESLGKLAKTLFVKLKSKISNLYEYKFDVRAEIFPILTFTYDESSSNTVRDFLSTLLFYTSQNNEEIVEKTLIFNISDSQCDAVQNTEITSDAIFLKYHDEIQKWWMTPLVGPYLTKDGSLYTDALKHATTQTLISVIKMMQRIKNKNYTFNEVALNSIKLDDLPSGTIIVSENFAFSVAKITRHFNNKHCFVLDLEYILNLSIRDDKILRTELMRTNDVKIVIVVFDNAIINTISRIKLNNIANSIKDKVIIIITDQNSLEIAKQYFPEKENVIKDERNNLTDLSEESQRSILDNTTVIVQGDNVTLSQVLDDTAIGSVGGEVLNKIMNGNKNIIGKPISNSNFKSKVYIQRTVRCVTYSYPKFTEGSSYRGQAFDTTEDRTVLEGISKSISTLFDIEDTVIILGEPGIGKSTLLTHLSLKTKELYPSVWILRINLLDYSKQLSEWQKHGTVISTVESVKFMCQVALSEERSKGDLEITLEESDDSIFLKSCTSDAWTEFELKIFLHYYNKKKLIILFDGFDEICPTYANEALSLMKVVNDWPQKHKLWITSRSYGKMITISETWKSYRIEPLKNDEQRDYLTKFWDEKELVKDLNDVQLRNIYDFSIFMSKSDDLEMLMKKQDLPVHPQKDLPFLAIYLNLVRYLLMRLNYTCLENFRKCRQLQNFIQISYSYLVTEEDISKLYADTLIALNTISRKMSAYTQNFFTTPLHLNIMAEYLYNLIRKTHNEPNKWDLGTNIFNIYELFLETKMKIIRFQEKNNFDMNKPDNIFLYTRIYENVMEKHKKLAAYAIYNKCLFDKDELEQVQVMINELKEGEERTGIICNVINDTPIFIHSTFAEYFAVEYICDLLRSKGNLRSVWSFILNVMFFNSNANVLSMFNTKMKIDENLSFNIAFNSKIILDLLLEQGKNSTLDGEMKSALCEAIRHNLRNLGLQLLSTINSNLNNSNLMDFIEIVKGTNMLLVAVKMEIEEVVVTIVNTVRLIDPSKISVLFEDVLKLELIENINNESVGELVQTLHRHVWRRMSIFPIWEKLSELSGQIYFI